MKARDRVRRRGLSATVIDVHKDGEHISVLIDDDDKLTVWLISDLS